MPAKPKDRKPPPGQGKLLPVQLRLEPELVKAVDARVAELNAERVLKLTRTDVVRLLLNGWLSGRYKLDEKGTRA